MVAQWRGPGKSQFGMMGGPVPAGKIFAAQPRLTTVSSGPVISAASNTGCKTGNVPASTGAGRRCQGQGTSTK